MQAVVANEISLDAAAAAAAGVRAQTARRFRPDGPTHPSPLLTGGGLGGLSLLTGAGLLQRHSSAQRPPSVPSLIDPGRRQTEGADSFMKERCLRLRIPAGAGWGVADGGGVGERGQGARRRRRRECGWGGERRAGRAPAGGKRALSARLQPLDVHLARAKAS